MDQGGCRRSTLLDPMEIDCNLTYSRDYNKSNTCSLPRLHVNKL